MTLHRAIITLLMSGSFFSLAQAREVISGTSLRLSNGSLAVMILTDARMHKS